MNDTTPEMQQKQKEIMLKMTTSERIKQGVDMIDFAYNTVKNRIKNNNKSYNEKQIIAKLFKEYYKNDFDKNEIDTITDFIVKSEI